MPPLRQGLLVLWVGACSLNGLTQEVIYRCGQEYTNAPRDVSRCERLAEQAITVITGVHPQGAPTKSSRDAQPNEEAHTKAAPAQASTAKQSERDAQARTILLQELERVQKQHQTWVQAYKRATLTQRSSGQATSLQEQERWAELKTAIERAERDIDSLQRELAMKPVKP